MIRFTDEQMAEALRQMVQATFVLTAESHFTPSRAARNVVFHAEEMMKAIDTLRSGREPPADELLDE